MNKNNLISVIMPVFNRDEYLKEAIDSIINQSYKNWELIIIIDKNSNEKSFEICREYEHKNNKIKLYIEHNKGISVARNRGILESKGKYIAMMDSDDISLPTRLEEQYNFMEKNIKVAVSGTRMKVFGVKNYISAIYENHTECIKAIKTLNVPIEQAVSIFRADILKKVGYREKLNHCEDFDLFCRILEFGELANLDKILLKYRTHKANRSSEFECKISACFVYLNYNRRKEGKIDYYDNNVKESKTPDEIYSLCITKEENKLCKQYLNPSFTYKLINIILKIIIKILIFTLPIKLNKKWVKIIKNENLKDYAIRKNIMKEIE